MSIPPSKKSIISNFKTLVTQNIEKRNYIFLNRIPNGISRFKKTKSEAKKAGFLFFRKFPDFS